MDTNNKKRAFTKVETPLRENGRVVKTDFDMAQLKDTAPEDHAHLMLIMSHCCDVIAQKNGQVDFWLECDTMALCRKYGLSAFFDSSTVVSTFDCHELVGFCPTKLLDPIVMGYDAKLDRVYLKLEIYAMSSMHAIAEISRSYVRIKPLYDTQVHYIVDRPDERGAAKRART